MRSPKQLIMLLEPKVEGHDQKKFRSFAPDRCPLTFALDGWPPPPLSNWFRRHCSYAHAVSTFNSDTASL